MKKFLLLMLVVWTGIASSCKYDDDELWGSVDDLANRISALETLTQQMNGDISAMKAIVTALENQEAVSEVEKLTAEAAAAAETVSAQEAAIAALEKEGEELTAQKTAAEDALARAESDKAGLETQVAAMTAEIAAMQEAMVALAAEEPVVP